jgi:hypothetical protein
MFACGNVEKKLKNDEKSFGWFERDFFAIY